MYGFDAHVSPFSLQFPNNILLRKKNCFRRRLPVAFGKIAYGPTRSKINPEHLMPYLQYGTQLTQPRRRPSTSFRLSGGGHMIAGYPPQSGSFNHLKVSL